jgi:chromosome partitioning protein
MRQKNKTSLEFEEWLRMSSGFDVFSTPVRRSIAVEKSSIAMTAVPKFAKNGITTKDYRSIVQELLEEMEE